MEIRLGVTYSISYCQCYDIDLNELQEWCGSKNIDIEDLTTEDLYEFISDNDYELLDEWESDAMLDHIEEDESICQEIIDVIKED